MLALFWFEISGLPLLDGENFWLASRKVLVNQRCWYFISFQVYCHSITLFSCKTNKIAVVSEVFWFAFQSLSYSIPLSFKQLELYCSCKLLDKVRSDLVQMALPTQQISNIGFIVAWDFWLTSHRMLEFLAYIKETTGRSKILIFHKVIMYPCGSITLFYGKHRKRWNNGNFLACFFKSDMASRL